MKENQPNTDNTDFNALIRHISDVQEVLQRVAAHAVNLSLTARNWLIGFYIVEYEQHGEERRGEERTGHNTGKIF